MLRQYESMKNPENSLSRCTALTKGFIPEIFKIAPPIPNAENKYDTGVDYLM